MANSDPERKLSRRQRAQAESARARSLPEELPRTGAPRRRTVAGVGAVVVALALGGAALSGAPFGSRSASNSAAPTYHVDPSAFRLSTAANLQKAQAASGMQLYPRGSRLAGQFYLAVIVAGQHFAIPPGIGTITIGKVGAAYTETPDGLVNLVKGPAPTLAQFLAQWGVPYAHGCVGPVCPRGADHWIFVVDGQEFADPASVELVPGASIVMALGKTPGAHPLPQPTPSTVVITATPGPPVRSSAPSPSKPAAPKAPAPTHH